MPHPVVANTLWFLSSLGDAWAYRRAAKNVAASQERLLMKMLRANSQTRFGQAHDFASISSIADYQRQVTLSDYDSYAASIADIAAGQRGILTTQPVTLFEPTSGSTAATCNG